MLPASGKKKKPYILPGVYKLHKYWRVFVRHIHFFSELDKKAFWIGIIAGLARAPMNAGKILLTGLLVDSIVKYYQSSVTWNFLGIQIPTPVFYVVGIVLFERSSFLLKNIGTLAEIKLQNRSAVAFRKKVTVKFHKLNPQEIDQEHVKDLVTKINTFWKQNAIGLYATLRNLGSFLLSIIIAFTTLLSTDAIVACIVLLVPTLQIIAVQRHYNRYGKYVDDTN